MKHHGDRALHVGRAATNEFLLVFENSRIVWTGPPRNEIRNRNGVEMAVHDNGRPSLGITERDNDVWAIMVRSDHLKRQLNRGAPTNDLFHYGAFLAAGAGDGDETAGDCHDLVPAYAINRGSTRH